MSDRAVPMSIRLDHKTKKALERAARDDSRSMNNLMEKIVSEWLQREGYLK